jgi:hypothetical protein
MFNAFKCNVWITLFTTMIFLVIFTAAFSKFFNYKSNKFMDSIQSSIWIYYQPLIGKSNIRKPNLLYLLWLLMIIPMVEIFRNDLLANLISAPTQMADTIDDLLDTRISNTYIYAESHYNYLRLAINESQDSLILRKLKRVADKSSIITPKNAYELLIDPDHSKMQNFVKFGAIIGDEHAIKGLYAVWDTGYKFHVGKEKYFAKLISPICFRPNFNETQLADNMYVNNI